MTREVEGGFEAGGLGNQGDPELRGSGWRIRAWSESPVHREDQARKNPPCISSILPHGHTRSFRASHHHYLPKHELILPYSIGAFLCEGWQPAAKGPFRRPLTEQRISLAHSNKRRLLVKMHANDLLSPTLLPNQNFGHLTPNT